MNTFILIYQIILPKPKHFDFQQQETITGETLDKKMKRLEKGTQNVGESKLPGKLKTYLSAPALGSWNPLLSHVHYFSEKTLYLF